MARVKRGTTALARKAKIFEAAKGYRGRHKNVLSIARQVVEKGMIYAYRDRRTKKREFRALWIQRINAGVREVSGHAMTYSQFIDGLIKAGIEVDRKVLSDLAIHEKDAFAALVTQAQAARSQASA